MGAAMLTTAYAALTVAGCIAIGLAIGTVAATAAMQVIGAVAGVIT